MVSRQVFVVLLALSVLGCAGSSLPTPTPTPSSAEYRLAHINGNGLATSADLAAFKTILDQLQAGGRVCAPEPDRQHVADTLVISWQVSGQTQTLLVWAQSVVDLCK
jgi:hypothetical protein